MMRVKNAKIASVLTIDADLQNYLSAVTEAELIEIVHEIAVPRHFRFNSANNRFVAELIYSRLKSFGYDTHLQGSYANVIALSPNSAPDSELILIGAHYDSVPDCPGADDNASAVAALMVCARILSQIAPQIPVCFAAFNCEEDGLVGSRNFVSDYLSKTRLKIAQAHILEMIGYATDEENTQSMPPGLPIKIPSVGNFLGILGNQQSNHLIDQILSLGNSYLPGLPVLGLQLFLGVEKLMPDFGRSDHQSFWDKKIPALMWTDTADFRNPHYHRVSDTSETLNYKFLKGVTQLLLLEILSYQI